MTNFVNVVKANPGVAAALVVLGFALGAMHHYFGL